MFKVSEFVKEHPYLTAATLGTAIIGFLGYRAILWVLIKCGLVEKVDNVAIKTLNNPPKKTIDLKSKWWTNVTESIEYKAFKQNWKALADSRYAVKTASQLKKAYRRSSVDKTDPHFGPVLNVPAEFSFWMKGVAFMASYLEAKKNVQGIFVCRDLTAIHAKIEEIHKNPSDQKVALIVGLSNDYPQYPQHKASILIEKRAGNITIAVLDPMPENHNKEINPDNILSGLERVGDYSPYNSKEMIFRQVYRACKNNKIPAKFFDSAVRRELHGGCAIFALQDALAFQRDPNFFEKLHVSEEIVIDSEYKINVIDLLPPEVLVGTQSISALKSYEKAGVDFKTPLIGRKKPLKEYLETHTVIVDGKPQNHYITKKFFSYMKFLVQSLETIPESEIDQIANRCLL